MFTLATTKTMLSKWFKIHLPLFYVAFVAHTVLLYSNIKRALNNEIILKGDTIDCID